MTEDIFDRYIKDFPLDGTQEDVVRYNKIFNLREGVGCSECGGTWESNLVTDGKSYYHRCADCGNLRQKQMS